MEEDGAPDLTDFMNDWFFGTVGAKHIAASAGTGGAYDLTGESSSSKRKPEASSEKKQQQRESDGGRGSRGSSSASKQTQEWLEEVKRMVGSGSPGRMGTPSRQVPRFAGGNGTEPSPTLDRRDPMSRSARRYVNQVTPFVHPQVRAHGILWPGRLARRRRRGSICNLPFFFF